MDLPTKIATVKDLRARIDAVRQAASLELRKIIDDLQPAAGLLDLRIELLPKSAKSAKSSKTAKAPAAPSPRAVKYGRHNPAPQEVREQILALRKEGISHKEIAQRLGFRNASAVMVIAFAQRKKLAQAA